MERIVGKSEVGEEECKPPSEKESGVRFRMAIRWVGRAFESGVRGGRMGW